MQTGRGWREGRAEDTIAFKRHFIGTFMIEHQYCKQKGDLLGKNYRVHLYWSLKGSAAYLQSKSDPPSVLCFGLHYEVV